MAKILYQLKTGQTVDFEVSGEFATAYSELEKESKREKWRNNWRNRKKLVSMDKLGELGVQFRNDSTSPEEICIEDEDRQSLHKAIQALLPNQRKLIYRLFFNGETQAQIARELGIGESAVRSRLAKIYAKLKQNLSR